MHCRVTTPYENGVDILKHIAREHLRIMPGGPHYAWPSKQQLAPVMNAKLPKDVSSYLTAIKSNVEEPIALAVKGAIDSFTAKQELINTKKSSAAFKDLQTLRMLPPPPRPKVIWLSPSFALLIEVTYIFLHQIGYPPLLMAMFA